MSYAVIQINVAFGWLWRGTITSIVSSNTTEKSRANHGSLVHYCFLVVVLLHASDSIEALRWRPTTWWSKIDSWEVPNTICIAFCLVQEDLLKYVIPPGLPLHLLQHQIVCRCDLIVLVVLYKDRCLVEEVWISHWKKGVIPDLSRWVPHISHHGEKSLIDDWNRILAHNDTLKVRWLWLIKPVMRPDVFNSITCRWVGVQDLFYQILAVCGNEAWYQIVTIQDLLIEFVSVRILKR